MAPPDVPPPPLLLDSGDRLEDLIDRILAKLRDERKKDEVSDYEKSDGFLEAAELHIEGLPDPERKREATERLQNLRLEIERIRMEEAAPAPDPAPPPPDPDPAGPPAAPAPAPDPDPVAPPPADPDKYKDYNVVNRFMLNTHDALFKSGDGPENSDGRKLARMYSGATAIAATFAIFTLVLGNAVANHRKKAPSEGEEEDQKSLLGRIFGIGSAINKLYWGGIAALAIGAAGVVGYLGYKYKDYIGPLFSGPAAMKERFKKEAEEFLDEKLRPLMDKIDALKDSLPDPERALVDSANESFIRTTEELKARPGMGTRSLASFEGSYGRAMLKIRPLAEEKRKAFLKANGFFDDAGDPKTVEIVADDGTKYEISCTDLNDFAIVEKLDAIGTIVSKAPLPETAEGLFISYRALLASADIKSLNPDAVKGLLRMHPVTAEMKVDDLIDLAEKTTVAEIKAHKLVTGLPGAAPGATLTDSEKAVVFLARVCKVQFEKKDAYKFTEIEDQLRALTLAELFAKTGQKVRAEGRVGSNISILDRDNKDKIQEGLARAFSFKDTISVEMQSASVRSNLEGLHPGITGNEAALIRVCKELASDPIAMYNRAALDATIRPPLPARQADEVHELLTAVQTAVTGAAFKTKIVTFSDTLLVGPKTRTLVENAFNSLRIGDAIQLYIIYKELGAGAIPLLASSLGTSQLQLKVIELMSRSDPAYAAVIYKNLSLADS